MVALFAGATAAKLGNGTATVQNATPVPVDTAGALNDKTVTAISAGGGHTCAVAGGRAFCWGRNDFGQLGGGTFTDALAPVAVT